MARAIRLLQVIRSAPFCLDGGFPVGCPGRIPTVRKILDSIAMEFAHRKLFILHSFICAPFHCLTPSGDGSSELFIRISLEREKL